MKTYYDQVLHKEVTVLQPIVPGLADNLPCTRCGQIKVTKYRLCSNECRDSAMSSIAQQHKLFHEAKVCHKALSNCGVPSAKRQLKYWEEVMKQHRKALETLTQFMPSVPLRWPREDGRSYRRLL